jgi:hypothetical protein
LIQDGKIHDPNYSLDAKGKLTFLRGTKRARADGEGSSRPTITHKRKRASKKRSGSSDEDSASEEEDEEEEEEEDEKKRSAEKKPEYLLDMNDAMTMKPMSAPAISPFGHVLDYTTWLRLLRETPQNTCPFTKQKVTRRDLVKLTAENMEEYRDKIVMTKFVASSSSAGSPS